MLNSDIIKKYIDPVKTYYVYNKDFYYTIYRVFNLFEIYFKYRDEFLKEDPDYNEDELLKALAWCDVNAVPFLSDNEGSAALLYWKYLNKQNYKKNNIHTLAENLIISLRFDNHKYPSFEYKILYDLIYYDFSDYNLLLERERKIDNEFFYYMNNHIDSYNTFYHIYHVLKNKNIYKTHCFARNFNKLTKENILKRISEKFYINREMDESPEYVDKATECFGEDEIIGNIEIKRIII